MILIRLLFKSFFLPFVLLSAFVMLTLSACSDKSGSNRSSNTESLSVGMGRVDFLFSASTLDVSFLSMQFSEIALVNAQGQSVIVTPDQGLSVNFASWLNKKGLLLSAQVPEDRYVEVHLKVTSSSIDLKELWDEKLISPSLYSLYGDPVSDKEILVFEQTIDEGFSLLAEENSHAILDISLDIEASHELLTISDDSVDRSFSPVFDVSRINAGSDVSFQMTGALVDVDQSTVTIRTLHSPDNTGGSAFSIGVDANTGFVFDGESVSHSEWLEKIQSFKTADSYVSAHVSYQAGIATAFDVRMGDAPKVHHHEGIRTAHQGYIGGVNIIDADHSQKPHFKTDSIKAPYPMTYSGISTSGTLPLQSPLKIPSVFLFKVTDTVGDKVSATPLAVEQYVYTAVATDNIPVALPIASDVVNQDDYIFAAGDFAENGELSIDHWQYYDDPVLSLELSLPLADDLTPLTISSDGEIVISDEISWSSMMLLRLFSWPIGLLPEGDSHPIRSIRLANFPNRLMLITNSLESETVNQQSHLKRDWIDIGKALLSDGWSIKKIDAQGKLAGSAFIAESVTLHLIETVIDDEQVALLKGVPLKGRLLPPSHRKKYVVTATDKRSMVERFESYLLRNKQKINSDIQKRKKDAALSEKTTKSPIAKKKKPKGRFIVTDTSMAPPQAKLVENQLDQTISRVRKASLFNPEIGHVIASATNKALINADGHDLFIRLTKQLHEIPPLGPILTKTDPVVEAQILRLLQDYVDASNEGNLQKMQSSIFHPYFEDGQKSEIFVAFKSQPPMDTVNREKDAGRLPQTLNDRLLSANPELTDILIKKPHVYRAIFDLQVNYLVKNNFSDTKSLDVKLGHMLATDDKVSFYSSLNKKLNSLEGEQADAIDQQLKQVNKSFIDFVASTDESQIDFDSGKVIKAFQSSILVSDQPLLKKYGDLTLATSTVSNAGLSANDITPRSNTLSNNDVNADIPSARHKGIIPPTFSDGQELLNSRIIIRRKSSISSMHRKQ